jgi:hypothetical protein
VGWISLGVIALALVLLTAAIMALLGHVRTLGLALRRSRLRGEQAQRLQARLMDLEERVAQLQADLPKR